MQLVRTIQVVVASQVEQLTASKTLSLSSESIEQSLQSTKFKDSVSSLLQVNPLSNHHYNHQQLPNLIPKLYKLTCDHYQGYRLHHRNGFGGDWQEVIESPSGSGSRTVELRNLPCGSSRHVYVTSFNSHGTSPQSNMLITSTQGSYPRHPDKMQLLEMNRTCLTVRPYTWLENECPITHWKIEESVSDTSWKVVYPHLPRSTTDVGLCNIAIAESWYLLKVIAYSTAGKLAVVYKIDTNQFLKGSITYEMIKEVLMDDVGNQARGWLDIHVITGVISAVFMTIALVICVAAAFYRMKYTSNKQREATYSTAKAENARNSDLTQSQLYSPASKKKSRDSLDSIKTLSDAKNSFEICPYATCSGAGTIEDSLIYGLSLHDEPSSRDLMDQPPLKDLDEATYAEQQIHSSHYKKIGNMPRRNSMYKCKDDSSSQLHAGSHNNQTENPLYQEHKLQKKTIQEDTSQDPGSQPSPRTSSRSQSNISSPSILQRFHPQSAFTNTRDLAECDRELIKFNQVHKDQSRIKSKSVFTSMVLHQKQDTNLGKKEITHQIHKKKIGKPHMIMQSDSETENVYMQHYGFQQKEKKAEAEDSSYGRNSYTIH
ncbi:unnamed protein product, partial [Meganyctiphanes norvegica]